MGRLENKLTAAQILYPLMQATDIFFLKADICQLGVDQRKVCVGAWVCGCVGGCVGAWVCGCAGVLVWV
jgi:hypothetical protein